MYTVENLEVPEKAMKQFEEIAKLATSEKFSGLDFMCMGLGEKVKVDSDIKTYYDAYVQALVDNFKRNNGIPPIPFPVSLSTVDMVCVCKIGNDVQMLLGRKPKIEQLQFPGGFRDAGELSRLAASRETKEEVGLDIHPNRFVLIDELYVDDVRYRNKPHKITTSVFIVEISEDEMKQAIAGDDLAEVKPCFISELLNDRNCIRDIHLPIFDMAVNYIIKKTQL